MSHPPPSSNLSKGAVQGTLDYGRSVLETPAYVPHSGTGRGFRRFKRGFVIGALGISAQLLLLLILLTTY